MKTKFFSIISEKYKLKELKKVDDNQDQPFYMTNSTEKKGKKEKPEYLDSPENQSDDSCENSDSDLNEISDYDISVNYLRSKGLDPYRFSKEQRAMLKNSPAFQSFKNNYLVQPNIVQKNLRRTTGVGQKQIKKVVGSLKQVTRVESTSSLDIDTFILEKQKVEIIKRIIKEKIHEDLLDVDKLNKPEANFKDKSSVKTGSEFKSKSGKISDAEYVMTRDKTLTGSKDCDIVEINPKLKTMRPHQTLDKNV